MQLNDFPFKTSIQGFPRGTPRLMTLERDI